MPKNPPVSPSPYAKYPCFKVLQRLSVRRSLVKQLTSALAISTHEMYFKVTVGVARCKREELCTARDLLFLRAQVHQCIKAPTYRMEICIFYSIISCEHSTTVSPSESCTRLVP
ncbi:hypothetical protein HBI75_017680 [Parastagonospora nodorum]|nr:hypothetical protein HBI75_017680 [Parastagonospora nodorum]